MASGSTIDVQEFMNERPFTGFRIRILIYCFLIVAADGFDTSAIGFIAPALREQWGLSPSQLSLLFVSGLAGLMAGAFVFGPVADRIGRKKVLIAATIWFGVASILSATATNVEILAAWRFVGGLGLGGAMPMAITLTSEFSPDRSKSFHMTIMFCGFTVGGAAGGLAAAGMVADYGWEGVLVIGGIAPLILAVLLAVALPESVRYLVLRGNQEGRITRILERVDPAANLNDVRFVGVQRIAGSPVRHMFTPDLVTGTLLLWLTFFMSLLVYYLLTSWLPTLLKTAGQSHQSAALIALMLPIGSTVGAIGIGYLMDRLGAHLTLAAGYMLAAVFIVLLGLSADNLWLLVLAVFGAGVGTGGSNTGLNALSASVYPTASRATGVSWANAIGRTGSLVGSVVGGYLLNIGWGLDAVFAAAAVPALVAAITITVKGRNAGGSGVRRRESLRTTLQA
ncbi:MFS transporter [Inquilinus sp. Marseille-Q2685]|uniref:MFS transporter n=1 Tax=Inquilinus sp. Marseille-Q2685 TaxID=2866581 RepID=UPI001CE3BE1B|nr:MFS transporter [Inquilinus sp. Marseille-Q2685]